jgi:hypothetical protein
MKTLLGAALTLFVLAVWVAAPGCSHLQPIADDAKSCAGDAYNEVRQEILPKTNSALACVLSDPSDTPQCVLDGVEALAAEYGWSFVTCALESFAGGKAATPSDNEAAVKQRRAKAVLERRKAATIASVTPSACDDGAVIGSDATGTLFCERDGLRIPFGVRTYQAWRDETPASAVAVGNGVPGGRPTNDLVFSSYDAVRWREMYRRAATGRCFEGDGDARVEVPCAKIDGYMFLSVSPAIAYGWK